MVLKQALRTSAVSGLARQLKVPRQLLAPNEIVAPRLLHVITVPCFNFSRSLFRNFDSRAEWADNKEKRAA